MKVLVTGCAGFIGNEVTKRLLTEGHEVMGIDNLNDYYDPSLKKARLARIKQQPHFQFHHQDIAERDAVLSLCQHYKPERIIHLAAQAGVRYSLTHPHSYVDSNLIGFTNILEAARHTHCPHLVYASSSSVYGQNQVYPYKTTHQTDNPISLYAATKKANEVMAHAYSHLYDIPMTGLRYFTVYGPWGRPDMAPMHFAQKIMQGEAIDVYNHGNCQRDFTFIDDIVEGTLRVMANIPVKTLDAPAARIFNIGYGQPVGLMDFITLLEQALEKPAIKNFLPAQAGDVVATWADVSDLEQCVGYRPQVSLAEGIPRFVEWFKNFYTSK